jgi:hypothetical protein
VFIDSRGSRGGMFSKMDYPVLEIHTWGWGDHCPACIRQRNHVGQVWKSEQGNRIKHG